MLAVLVAVGAVATAVPVVPASAADEHIVLADDWARPRSGVRVAALPGIRAAVDRWRADGGGAAIAIVHPGGEAGAIWGAEVRDWLVALGIPPTRLTLQAGSARADALILRMEAR